MKMLVRTSSFVAVIAVIFALVFVPVVAFAQENPAVDTPTAEPPTPTETIKTPTPEPPTPVPSATPTTRPTEPPSEPVPIPEPVTVVLFGTGLAALSAAAAARRKKE
ncbi:MAG: PEP-CTERM sorting domain-containing protein [Caldilineaceae bacterium]|nr:PEP-CTERM sorting domain-containing protein [Caldilineaceae bacterium]MCB9159045.1 PEP-CTERM sorting domain-containing protein [Caldilineaceae bacterium]